MPNNLFLKATATDTGARPLPPGTLFWQSPAVTLATADGNYTVGTPTTINVQVSINEPQAFQFIAVEVWVCDPTTVAGPTTALAPFAGATSMQLMLSGTYAPPSGQSVSTVPVISVTGFLPYTGISTLPGGHCCLIANCYGQLMSGDNDGASLNSNSAINLPNEVQTDAHVAQRNIFADAVPPGPHKKISFPFKAATPLPKGAEHAAVEIHHASKGAQLSQSDLDFLRRGRHGKLELHASNLAPKSFTVGGGHIASKQHVTLQLHAGKPVTMTVDLELDPAEKIGAVHAFDVIQKDAHGKVQGGFRLLAVVGH